MKWFILGFFLLSILIVHFRGKVRMPLLRQMVDHSGFMAPLNLFMYGFSRVPNQPYLPMSEFPELEKLTSQWQVIREEALALIQLKAIRAADANNDAGFNSFFKEGWKRFYLKWYGDSHPSAITLCPKTVEILKTIPSVKAAMFAELPPGSHLNAHRDPYAGSLRYHLGLATPNDDRCFINVDGEPYSWRDGQAVMFDETFIHFAENGTQTDRVILFCDIERPMKYRWAQVINHWLGRNLIAAASSPNETGDKTGFINKLFVVAFVMGQYRRRFKAWNKTVYQITRVLLIASVIALIVYW